MDAPWLDRDDVERAARSLAGRLTPSHDIDIWNVALFWHFLAVTAAVTHATVALFPTVSG